ncbi:MAG: ribosome assembly cofactor RimP [Bacteroidetes bacterium]|nr:ribosome assembly cofactor RimP [Bacteroidota bacterium]
MVEEKIAGTEIFLVDIKLSPSKIMVYIDRPEGIKIEDCVAVSKHVQDQLEESNILEHHELEVSSPGMDEPLKVLPQYRKRIGKEVNVVTFDGLKHSGILESADENGIVLKEIIARKEKGKKEKSIVFNPFSFTQIKETKIAFSFENALKS